ncbi:nucleotidyltransferase family protein [Flagellimonas sp.]|uniref:nucleotidyltransferase family protein n=1 Tax=Flagellimonas sp. TaxID=2058762 RepID=UPI003F4A166F
MPKNISALVLAAGASKRMPNRIKQLLPWGDSNLLENAIHQISPLVDKVHIVLGAYADEIREALPKDTISHSNPKWEIGMGSSISFGISQILQGGKEPDAIFILVPDQPLMDSEHFQKLQNTFLENKNIHIVATDYGNQRSGVPAIFDSTLFPELQALQGDYGAKGIIQDHLPTTKLISGEGKEIDVDTYEAYIRLKGDTKP